MKYLTVSNLVSFALGVAAGWGGVLLFFIWLANALEGSV